ncbi:MAG: epoxyqueuosine reductase QueH [Clostridia bacterium]|nr:epoxyqueuosine reductase QueH [Clostridia bacterium]
MVNSTNYSVLLEKFLQEEQLRLTNGEKKKKLLLHACCAPCSSFVITYLKDYFDITLFFYNPNITDLAEYNLRLDELKRFANNFGLQVIDIGYNQDEFYSAIKGLENEREGGGRCAVCYNLRLSKTAKLAKENGYDLFCSTLSISPLKNAKLLNEIGYEKQNEYDVTYLINDFKKKGGYLRSIELSKEYGLYRQNYCGCEYSKR